MMENRLLKYFLVAAQEENITKAAEILRVSQPALSKQIMQLEDELGAKLFIRGKRSLSLTEEGRFLRSRAQEIVDLTEKTERDFKDGIVSYNGTVSIGMGETAASRWLSAQAEKFSESYPDVRFDFYSATADSVREKIEKGLLDMGLLIEPTGDLSKYDFIRLPVKDRWGVLFSVENPLAGKDFITRDDLMQEKLFIPFRIFPRLKEMLGISTEEITVRGTHNLLYNVASVVQDNSAAAITIGGAAELYDSRKLIWKPISPEIGFHSVLIWKKYKSSSPSAAKFLEFINHSVSL